MGKTAHLSLVEQGAYTVLLDHIYSTERPLPPDLAACYRIARAFNRTEQVAVDTVLAQFFTLACDGYMNGRALKEIEKYRAASAKTTSFWKRIPRYVRTAIQAARHARKLNATPAWLSDKHKSDIKAIYKDARRITVESGERHEVDHIVPLVSKFVCGLHVPWNLQILPADINRAKSNHLQ